MNAAFDRVRIPVLALGIIALLSAAVWYLVSGDFGIPPRLLLVVGVLLVGIYVAIEPGEVAGALGSRGARYGSNALLVIVVFVGILALVNFLSVRHSQRWDVTANRSFSLSEQTQKVLDNLPAPVHVIAFMTPGDKNTENVESLLRNYQVRSDGKLDWETIDPDADPAAFRQYNLRNYNTILFQMGDKRQETTSADEAGLTSTLIKLVAATQPKVYFLTGHGEHSPDAATPESYAEMKRLLLNDNYQTETLNLLATGSVPADAAVLVVGGPTSPLQQEEIDAINQYTAGPGHLYLLVDPASAANVQPLVDRWGISFSGVVVDTASFLQIGQRANPLVPVIQKYGTHPVTRDLTQSGSPSVFVEAAAINVPTDRQTGVTITKLVESSDRSYTRPVGATSYDFVEGEDTRGPLTMAVAVEADVANAPPPPLASEGGTPPPPQPKTRAVIFGDSDFATNNFVRLAPGNRDFFLNTINWLSGSDELAAIRPKPPDQRQLFMTSVQRNAIFFSTVIFLPLILLVAGGLVWWGRR
jgi:ABC-type uncharacterized transport system involved in gliding motility auxiliary subunit